MEKTAPKKYRSQPAPSSETASTTSRDRDSSQAEEASEHHSCEEYSRACSLSPGPYLRESTAPRSPTDSERIGPHCCKTQKSTSGRNGSTDTSWNTTFTTRS